jgi:hypothetical protein
MANRPYQRAGQKWATAGLQWATGTWKATLTSSAYSPNTSNTGHEFLDDVTAGGRLATSTFSGMSISGDGIADAADMTFSDVTGTVTGLVIYKYTGTESTSPLVVLFDDFAGTLTFSAATVTVTWDASGIFKIG